MLPIGGVKEKTIAAARAGIRTVLLPSRNRKDLDEIPQSVKALVKLHFVDSVADVIALALEPFESVTAPLSVLLQEVVVVADTLGRIGG